MRYIKLNGPLIIIVLLYFWTFIFTLFNIYYDKNWIIYLVISYGLLILSTLVFIYIKQNHTKKLIDNIEEFKKTLKGGLNHFKCPTCKGIFAIKKSKNNNKKPIKMTCPDCGIIGIIPPCPSYIEEEIPEKKSVKTSFKCSICGEEIAVWAEGTDLYKNTQVLSCPFCGIIKPLKKL